MSEPSAREPTALGRVPAVITIAAEAHAGFRPIPQFGPYHPNPLIRCHQRLLVR